ncbi:MAG: 16S rRNA (uracil(1498)-N(3))-methyltransferase [Bacteroidales bacterium]|nr:16S rRNA (uracil(1498)-N(3))-methyltransferase [Bacteroidales bacterium]
MEIFFSNEILDGVLRLDAEEAGHCVRVLRHRPGDHIDVIDGRGTLYHCTLLDGSAETSSPAPGNTPGKDRTARADRHRDAGAVARIDSIERGWHAHPYRLTLAVCPTKNSDRYEWMAEKVTEIGLDCLVPVIGDRSERKVPGKEERMRKVLLSAAKQSLKGAVPEYAEAVSVKEFVRRSSGSPVLKLIAYCSDEVQPRASIMEELREFWKGLKGGMADEAAEGRHLSVPAASEAAEMQQGKESEIVVLIGPEGDFSPEEVREAMAAGFVPVSIGESRLRTETAAVTSAAAVYLSLL